MQFTAAEAWGYDQFQPCTLDLVHAACSVDSEQVPPTPRADSFRSGIWQKLTMARLVSLQSPCCAMPRHTLQGQSKVAAHVVCWTGRGAKQFPPIYWHCAEIQRDVEFGDGRVL